jgi:hypothetical protein
MFNVKADGSYSNHCALKSQYNISYFPTHRRPDLETKICSLQIFRIKLFVHLAVWLLFAATKQSM